ncbi:hypothetical protein GEN93_06220 [Escherichia coli]|nr:hypothetical protein [Escherichia coli]EFH9141912.1 hypothetical protein [Escherichia coli]HAH1093114.1 hypothetical protein [Escherichia coli]HAH3002610.1 hypothetical protein [Escherichia coli]
MFFILSRAVKAWLSTSNMAAITLMPFDSILSKYAFITSPKSPQAATQRPSGRLEINAKVWFLHFLLK